MGSNFIGPLELTKIANKMPILIPIKIPSIPFSLKEIKNKQTEYILILGISKMQNGKALTLQSLRNHFGFDSLISEPCFYNQDWYIREVFYTDQLPCKWYLIRKTIIDNTRAQNPDTLSPKISFPSAILCAYTFFVYWYHLNEPLWSNDYIWCKDSDRNKDRIFVGRYNDPHGANKNGFSIHRRLSIRNNYGCIQVL